VFLEKLNAEMNKATDQLRLEAQEEVLESMRSKAGSVAFANRWVDALESGDMVRV
jgi:hypothetical protein